MVPWVMLSTALVFTLAATPAWLLLKEPVTERASQAVFPVWLNLRRTFSELGRDFSEFRLLLLCIVCYQAGIAVVITLAAVYAEQVMGFSMTETIALIVAVNVTAALGALCFGYAQDRLGHRRALAIALIGWLITSVTAYAALNAAVFWCAACLAGVCMGVTQSAGRAMVGAFAPYDRLSRFFGLWSVSTQLAAAIGPLTYGIVTWVTGGDQRLAMLSTSMFFLLALLILKNISWTRGQAQRQAALNPVSEQNTIWRM